VAKRALRSAAIHPDEGTNEETESPALTSCAIQIRAAADSCFEQHLSTDVIPSL
jgi:hypothetical protein